MNPIKLVAVALIVAGLLGLVYGGFSYTKDTTVVKLGPIELSAKEKQTVNVPVWAGVGGHCDRRRAHLLWKQEELARISPRGRN